MQVLDSKTKNQVVTFSSEPRDDTGTADDIANTGIHGPGTFDITVLLNKYSYIVIYQIQ